MTNQKRDTILIDDGYLATMLFDSQNDKSNDFDKEDSSYNHNFKNYTDPFCPILYKENTNIVSTYLQKHLFDTSADALNLISPEDLLKEAKKLMCGDDSLVSGFDQYRFKKIVELYISTGIQVQSTNYMGRQFSSVIPLSGIIDSVSSIVNQPSSFYEASQLSRVAEKLMADEFNKFIAWKKDSFSMITTSGGSLANLTAILTARNKKYPEFWAKGTKQINKLPAIAINEDSHYSISRAAGILGIGEDQIIKLPVGKDGKIIVSKVEALLEKAKLEGLDVFCLVATAGTTSLGAFDNIEEISQITSKRDIWFHVDGAHGGALLVSDKLRHKLKGIDKADSFMLDAHKTLFVPSLCTLLFYKNKEDSQITFNQEASYVFEKEKDIYTSFDSGDQNFECTKRPLIMGLWTTWAIYGKEVFSNKLEYLCNLTQNVYELLLEKEDFETIHKPESNILCFRYVPTNFEIKDIGKFQMEIRNKIKEEGRFFISKVDIDNQSALRVVFMNHKINLEHFMLLLQNIREVGQSLLNINKG